MKKLISLAIILILIGYIIGEWNQEYSRNLLESNSHFKWISSENKVIVNTTNEYMVICIDNNCKKVYQWEK